VHTSLYWCVRKLYLFMRFWVIWRYRLSTVYRCVLARLQYMGGRDELMRQWSIIKIPYIDPRPQHVGVCHGVWMR